MATYRSAVAVDELDQAQAELQQHLTADAGGRCRTCQEAEPCRARNALTATILRHGRLPRRQPGRTRAGLLRRA